jgi:serine/threonine-protein kinase
MAAGLAHAHGRGLVHRDLKPANVLFDSEGRAKIADFGIARMGTSGTLTEAGTVLGTASYISPEQAGGLPAGPASDIYSFGVILFRMLTGRLPFVAANAMEVVRMHRDDPPPHVSDFRPDAPARLEALTTAALAKQPADRPADGTALLRELRRAAGDAAEAATMVAAPGALATAATQVVQPNRPGPSRRRRRASLAAVALAAAALLAGGVALALALSGGDSDAGNTASVPGLTLPTVATLGPTTSQATTTAQTTTAQTTTAQTTTARTTTAQTTTAQTTTAPVTLPTTTVAPPTTTVAPPTTTVAPPTTTAPATTDTVPTTTAPPVLPGAPTTTTGP